MQIRTIREVKAGEEIYNCYGPRVGKMVKAERQVTLERHDRQADRQTYCRKKTVSFSRIDCFFKFDSIFRNNLKRI